MTKACEYYRSMARRKRALLTKKRCLDNSRIICQKLAHFTRISHVSSIAAYLSVANEVNLQAFMTLCCQRKQAVYVPVLDKLKHSGKMHFVQWSPRSRTKPSPLGIAEPVSGRILANRFLSVVLVPLVGFSKQGARVGMGGGYYDRSFQHLKQNKRHQTLFIGVAHDCQKIPNCNSQVWDIPLDIIITEKHTYFTNKR